MPDDKRPRRQWDEGEQMAYELIQRHPELLADCPPPSDILFVLDTVNEPQSKGRPVPAKVSKITGKLVDFLDAGDKTWMLEWFTQNNGYMTLNQAYILLLQQLLLFEADGNGGHRIGGWDIQESEVIADRLGLKWASDKRGEAPNIMDPDFEWGRVGQSRINFAKAKAEAKRQREEAAGAPKAKTEQAQLNLTGATCPGINLKPTERATLTVPADGPPKLVIEGPDGIREVPVTSTTDGWQPEQPYATKDNVIPFRRPTGTDAPE